MPAAPRGPRTPDVGAADTLPPTAAAQPAAPAVATAPPLAPAVRYFARCNISHGWLSGEGPTAHEATYACGDEIDAARAAEMRPELYETR